MSNYTSINSTSNQKLEDFIYVTSQIFGYYIIPITAIIGLIIYLGLFILLLRSKLLINIKYHILLYRILNLLILFVIYIGYQNDACKFCIDRKYNSYSSQFYSLYIRKYLSRVISMTQSCFEVLISFERFCILNKKNNVLDKISLKFLYITCIVIFGLSRLVDFFSSKIEYSPDKNQFYLTTTSIGNSRWYFYYSIAISFGYYGICMVIVIFLNIFNINFYKKFINQKKKMLSNTDSNNMSKSEIRFTLIIIVTTTIFLLSLFNNLIANLFVLLYSSDQRIFSKIANLFLTISYEILLLTFFIDFFLYIALDNNLKKLLKDFIFFFKLI
jgi:hypothetical protein